MPGMENFAPERTETSSGSCRVAEPLAHRLLQLREVLGDLAGQLAGRVARSSR